MTTYAIEHSFIDLILSLNKTIVIGRFECLFYANEKTKQRKVIIMFESSRTHMRIDFVLFNRQSIVHDLIHHRYHHHFYFD